MRSSSSHTLALVVLLATGCRLESHPPAGLPADEAAIRSAVAAWLAKTEPWAQLVRADIRQDRDVATAWVITSPPVNEGQGERVTLLVLQRDAAGWTVEYHRSPSRPRS
jgi:outer membrane biogenesis lipoprotein LolB